jgi:hypothetical protein
MFLGLPDPHPDPLVRGMDPDPSCHGSLHCFGVNVLPAILFYLRIFEPVAIAAAIKLY